MQSYYKDLKNECMLSLQFITVCRLDQITVKCDRYPQNYFLMRFIRFKQLFTYVAVEVEIDSLVTGKICIILTAFYTKKS
jgi:hypothetical protein